MWIRIGNNGIYDTTSERIRDGVPKGVRETPKNDGSLDETLDDPILSTET
jgi:hypothetical protein